MFKLQGRGICFLKRDIQPRGISAKVPLETICWLLIRADF